MRSQLDPELDLAVRCAWLSFIGGRTHEEIGARVGLSRTRVTRLIQLAQRAGFVKVFIEGRSTACVALEEALIDRFGLANCSVAPDLEEGALPVAALGALGAQVLAGLVARVDRGTMAIGHGRTLAAAVDALPPMSRPRLRLVSLLGSLTRAASTHPYDVIFRLADRTGGTGYYMPAPFFCDSEEDRAVFLGQRDIRAVHDLAREATVVVAGIGALGPDYGMLQTGMITQDELDALVRAGAAGELLGTFVDAEGAILDAEINRRVIGPDLATLRGREVVAIAGGPGKCSAIEAVLRAGLVTHLVTDERTARSLAERAGNEDRRAPRKRSGGISHGRQV